MSTETVSAVSPIIGGGINITSPSLQSYSKNDPQWKAVRWFDGSIVLFLDVGGWLELSAGGWLMLSQL